MKGGSSTITHLELIWLSLKNVVILLKIWQAGRILSALPFVNVIIVISRVSDCGTKWQHDKEPKLILPCTFFSLNGIFRRE